LRTQSERVIEPPIVALKGQDAEEQGEDEGQRATDDRNRQRGREGFHDHLRYGFSVGYRTAEITGGEISDPMTESKDSGRFQIQLFSQCGQNLRVGVQSKHHESGVSRE